MEQPVWEDDTIPPSYDSIFSHLKDAKESQESAIGFFKKTVQTFASTSVYSYIILVYAFYVHFSSRFGPCA